MNAIIGGLFALFIGVPFLIIGFIFGFMRRGFVLGMELAEDILDA